jgi:glycosyltransferase involved in cell wall biosynthesis
MSNPRVVIDARMVGPVLHGLGRYVSLMVRGLARLGPLPYQPLVLGTAGLGFERRETRSPFLHPGELLEIPRLLRREGAALYHSPTFSSLPGALMPCPWIVTVHDLIHLRYGGLARKAYYRGLLRPFARGARALLTVSGASKRELDAWAGVPSEVVTNALDPSFVSTSARASGNYFFCLSNPKPHKNVGLLVEAYSAFRAQAGPGAPELVLSLAPPRPVPGVRGTGELPEAEASALVAGARAVFFPSLEEGFGLPPLEAAAIGVPIYVSAIPPHREVLSDLAPAEAGWVEPRDFHGWVNAFHRAMRGEVPGASAASRARLAERFSVERLARHMDRIYRRVLGIPG